MSTPSRELWGKTGAAFVSLLARAWPVLTANPRSDESGEVTIKVKVTRVPKATNGATAGPQTPDYRIELIPSPAKAPKGLSIQLEAVVIDDQLALFEPQAQVIPAKVRVDPAPGEWEQSLDD